jgi:phosphatidylserine decarboxylase
MPVVKDGLLVIVIFFLAGALLFLLFKIVGVLCIVIALFLTFFFRDPYRRIISDPTTVLSPCDGTVLEIGQEDNFQVVRVFLSVFSVHLQRSPVEGIIRAVRYSPGKFLPAMDPKAHIQNEHNLITIESVRGTFIVKQIAGILARRVVSWVHPEQRVEQGQKIGFIKFGSQVDLYMPKDVRIVVKVGDKVYGGKTIFGKTG